MRISSEDYAGVVDGEAQGLGRDMYQTDPCIPLLQTEVSLAALLWEELMLERLNSMIGMAV